MSTTIRRITPSVSGIAPAARCNRGVRIVLFCLFYLVPVTHGLFAGQESTRAGDTARPVVVRTATLIVGPDNKPFNMPSEAAVGPKGDLYVLDGVNNRVVVYDVGGKYRLEFGGHGSDHGKFQFPLGLAAGPDGNIYVADSGNHRFQIFTADGKLILAVPLPTDGRTLPPDPTDIVLDPQRHRLYIADNDNHQLDLFDLDTQSFGQPWGSPGQGERQLRFPFLIDISPEGYLFVVEPINTRVQVFNPSGKFVNFLGNWGVKAGQLFRPKGVAVFNQRIFISDSYLGRVQIFDIQGTFHGMLTDSARQPLPFVTPTGIAVDIPNRRLYVVELKANRVCRLDLE